MFPLLALALGLGIKHSFDADHVVAVSSFLNRSRSFGHALKMGLAWAAGHMLTAGIITVILYQLKETVLQSVLGYFEWAVAILLIAIGAISLGHHLIHYFRPHQHGVVVHRHLHRHNDPAHRHEHAKLFGVGIIQGLASNDELLYLLTISLGIASLPLMLTGIAVFSVGVAAGMVVFSLLFSAAILIKRAQRIRTGLDVALGLVSIGYGVYMIISFL